MSMSDSNPPNPSSGSSPPGDPAPKNDTYDVVEPEPSPSTRSPIAESVTAAPRLLNDFDEDADFDHDPEVEAARKRARSTAPP